MKYIPILLFLFTPFLCRAQKPILKDEVIKVTVRQGLDKLYNFEFNSAREKFQQVQTKYPDHPAYSFLMAQVLFWEMMYLDTYEQKSEEYLKHLEKAAAQALPLIDNAETKTEGIFFNLAAEGFMALYYSDRGDNMKAVKYARSAYASMKVSFGMTNELNEFFFTTGLYNYFVVKYPETHPVYKPFMGFFMDGNKANGFKQLDYASKNCTFTKTEALYYLTGIYLKYEVMPEKAIAYSQQLVTSFPNNAYFTSRYIETLIALERFDEAVPYIKKIKDTDKKYFAMAATFFIALIEEKQKKNLGTASLLYKEVITEGKKIKNPSKDFMSMAYLGLGRIELTKGNKEQAREYFKLARAMAEYDSVIQEADKYLKQND